jgi:hypothetical protein
LSCTSTTWWPPWALNTRNSFGGKSTSPLSRWYVHSLPLVIEWRWHRSRPHPCPACLQIVGLPGEIDVVCWHCCSIASSSVLL